LRLGQSGLDNTTLVPRDEHCRFLCSDCDRPLLVGPSTALPPPEALSSASAALLRAADATLAPTTPPTLIPSDGGNDLDACEVLLKRAIEMVRDPACSAPPTKGLTERAAGTKSGAGTPELDDFLSVHPAPPKSTQALIETDSDLDECEALLKRAIEMVRASRRWPPQPLDRMPRRSLMSRVVQIRHDPNDLTYVATDTKSGLSVLRHRDRSRLRTMCDRIGWWVMEDAVSKAPD
jgi:hypothetical protein